MDTTRGRRADGEDDASLLESLWDRPSYRSGRFGLNVTAGEHPCFAGFRSMVEGTDRCNGWTRSYPPVGSVMAFRNTASWTYSDFTLRAVVADHINVWLEGNSTEVHADIAIKAASIYTNVYDIPELRPSPDSNSWMEHECKVMGQLPFLYTCSDRVQILVQGCNGIENAWVMQNDYLQNFPGPANNGSGSNFDIVFYMCKELLDKNPNPYSAANTFAHELAHVIQGGFGFSFAPMTEGGATWLEGPLLNLAPRPMVYAWGFRDWNRILAAHIYATTKEANARKFYQIHAMFLTYLSQEELLGAGSTSALQNYQLFDGSLVPWGRMAYDYFLSRIGLGRPTEFSPILLNTTSEHNAFADALLNYRVAIVAQCILDINLRPRDSQYRLPDHLQERPYWDCSSFPAFWSADGTSVEHSGTDLHYGGAAFFRLAAPVNATITVDASADRFVRTKVVAAGNAAVEPEVVELMPGEHATFGGGAREIFVVQVNVDPSGETLQTEHQPIWRQSPCQCTCQCPFQLAWTTAAVSPSGLQYPDNAVSGLQTPLLDLPPGDAATLSFFARWALEQEDQFFDGCPAKGYDGVQVRVHVEETGDIAVLVPSNASDGYGIGPGGERAVSALRQLYDSDAPCASLEGWVGSSGSDFVKQVFSLEPFAGQAVRIEVVFASDASVAGEGFWLSNVSVRTASGVVFDGQDELLFDHAYVLEIASVTQDPWAGVPVVAQLPAGSEPDRALERAEQVRSAAWGARWSAPAVGSESALRRAYLGWSYSAPTEDTQTATLHTWQEACTLLAAPFDGALREATLFTLVDKIGVGGVTLRTRAAEPPHEVIDSCASESPGVTDPGVHRFGLASAFNAS
jgi:hypothetical protein